MTEKVEAEGSIWRLYFAPGTTPSAEEFAAQNEGLVKATIITPESHTALVTPTGGSK